MVAVTTGFLDPPLALAAQLGLKLICQEARWGSGLGAQHAQELWSEPCQQVHLGSSVLHAPGWCTRGAHGLSDALTVCGPTAAPSPGPRTSPGPSVAPSSVPIVSVAQTPHVVWVFTSPPFNDVSARPPSRRAARVAGGLETAALARWAVRRCICVPATCRPRR